jgi:hypothetical protein
MTFEEFGKFLNRTLLLSLDRISGPRLVRVVYILGLAVAVVWGIDHVFATFGSGFGEGVWGLIEIVVFGLFGITVLRVICEALIVYFEANKDAVQAASQAQPQTSLIDEVRDAIEQLGEEEAAKKATAELAPAKPAKPPASKSAAAKNTAPAKRAAPVRRTPRTAKRTPKPKPGANEG